MKRVTFIPGTVNANDYEETVSEILWKYNGIFIEQWLISEMHVWREDIFKKLRKRQMNTYDKI